MKKFIGSFLIFILIISCFINVYAYSSSEYSIDLPFGFYEIAENSFNSLSGENINVQITPYYSVGDPYTQANLNELVRTIRSQFSGYTDEIEDGLRQQYGGYMTDSQIRENVSSFRCNYIDVSEIATCTKNNYKCFHIIANYSMGDYDYFAEQYSIYTKTEIYTLTAGAETKEILKSSDIQNALNSFTIYNYTGQYGSITPKDVTISPDTELKEIKSVSSNFIVPIAMGGAVIVAIFIILYINSRGKNKRSNVNNEVNSNVINNKNADNNYEMEKDWGKSLFDDNDIKADKKYCTKCGKEIEDDWEYCKHCGNKLK